MRVQLPHPVADMRPDRLDRDAHACRDLLTRQTLGEEIEHLAFAYGQEQRLPVVAGVEQRRDRRIDVSSPAPDQAQCLYQLLGACRLEEEPPRTALECLGQRRDVLDTGVDQDRQVRVFTT